MDEKYIQIANDIQHLNHEIYQHWLNTSLFTWRWWLGVFLTIVPWILWILLRKKQSTNRLLFVGFFAIIFACLFDFLGTNLGLFYYPYRVVPLIPAYIPWDFTLIPIASLVLIQFKPNVHFFIKALILGILGAFVAEPFFIWLKLYLDIRWNRLLSFLFYVLLYLILHWLSRRKNFEPI